MQSHFHIRINHPHRSPAEITELLGRTPDVAGETGGRRGGPSSLAKWPTNFWSSEFIEDDVDERIAAITQFLASHDEQLLDLGRSGGSFELWIFLAPERSIGFCLPRETTALLGRLAFEIGVESYSATTERAK